jgi:hypothetical protein
MSRSAPDVKKKIREDTHTHPPRVMPSVREDQTAGGPRWDLGYVGRLVVYLTSGLLAWTSFNMLKIMVLLSGARARNRIMLR